MTSQSVVNLDPTNPNKAIMDNATLDPAAQDPSAAAAPEAKTPLVTIEIQVFGENEFTVSAESGEEEAAEGSETAEGPEGEPAETIKEALTLALQIFKKAVKGSGTSAEDQMSAGFNGSQSQEAE